MKDKVPAKRKSPESRRLSAAFGTFLRDTRKSRGMNQEEFGQLLGVSKQVLSKYERGEHSLPLATAWLFASKMGLSLDDVFGHLAPMGGVQMSKRTDQL